MFRLKYLPHKKPDEKIIFFLRRHWFVAFRIIVVYGLLGLAPVALYLIIRQQNPVFLQDETFYTLLALLTFVYYLYWWMMFYYAWLDYFLDIWIVTNYRVINIEQRGMFYRTIAENKLFRIQDVLSEQKGIIPTFLDYGKINIQTAGTKERIVFQQVPKPNFVAQELIKLIEWRKRKLERVIDKEEKADLNNERISGIIDK